MTQSFIILPTDAANTGKKLQTFDNTILANDVYAEAVTPVNSAGVEEGTSGNPIRVDPVGTTIQPDNVSQWGGVAVSAANTQALGSETAPVVRPISVKNCVILTTTPLAANGVFTSASGTGPSGWFDSAITGDTFVSVKALANVGSAGSGFVIQVSDDPTNAGLTQTIANGTVAAAIFTINTFINSRYWRVVYTNGSTLQTSFELTCVSGPFGMGILGQGIPAAAGVTYDLLQVTAVQNNTVADGQTTGGFVNTAGAAAAPAILNGFVTGNPASGSNYSSARTPAVFRGGQGGSAAGAFPIWIPSVNTKKVRLMKYKLDIAEDATITSGPLPVNISLQYGLPLSVAGTIITPPLGYYLHRAVVPATVLATSGQLYDSEFLDLGNGYISSTAGQTLFCGLQVPQSAGALTPSFTLPSSTQWEAGIFAFQTVSGRGNFKLYQASPSAAGVASAAVVPAGGTLAGNTAIVIVRTTNIAAGVPTVAVTDTQGNTYTALTAINNASDAGPTTGSSLQLFYCLNCVGGAANTITATSSVHAATATSLVYLEYQNISAIGATAQAVGTGNSVTPAAASFTPGETGDLVIMYAATATASQATLGSVSSPFFMRGRFGGATGPSIVVADNFGNGALSAGLVNVIAMGTEE